MRYLCYSLLAFISTSAMAGTENPFASSYQQREMELLDFYRSKAQQGDAHAQFKLGWAYETGEGLPQDTNAATRWYQRAAHQGHRNARLNLVIMDPDNSLKLDPEEKQFLDLISNARAGNRQAQIEAARQAVLGGYSRPELMSIYLWLKQLAHEGDLESQHLLATFYIQGRGVPQNFVRAYSWFSVAAASGYGPSLASRDAVAQLMSSSQLEQGQAVSMEFYENYIQELQHPKAPVLDTTGNVSQN